MELFGIILSIPAASIASAAYALALTWVLQRLSFLAAPLLIGSSVILVTFVIEAVLLLTHGAVRIHGAIGPAYFSLHLAIFLLGVPALANVLVLRGQVKLPLTVTICTAFALILVLTQYGVSEELYGINADTGPYSANTRE